MSDRTARTRALNDALRTDGTGGEILLTKGVAELPTQDRSAIVAAVRDFEDFTADNDPYNEHDCAVIAAAGHEALFKIEYYDKTLTSGSDDPADPDRTCRVMTIMLADEY
jgi:hypothetical protein